jgi:hypothetical protein
LTRISDINNRIEGHLILFDVEVSTDGVILPFDEPMNMNQSKYKRLGIRKIKCTQSEDPGYLFWLCVTFYHRVIGGSYINIMNIYSNLTTETTIDIGNKIISHLNDYLESKDKLHRFRTCTSYGNVIRIEWYKY